MSLATDVQELVDSLAAELDRPVELDDQRFRSLAYSSHHGRVDEVRLRSILQREAPPEVVEWLESLGVRSLDRFTRVAAREDLGMAARVCVPVRFDGVLLGLLWLIDEPSRLSDSQLADAEHYVEEIAVALYRQRVLDQDGRRDERALLERALGDDDANHEAAANELVREGHLAATPGYVALVLRAAHPDGAPFSDPIRVRLADVGEQLRRSVAPHHALTLAAGDEMIAVVAASAEEEGERRAEALIAMVAEALAGQPGWDVKVGTGGWFASVEELCGACGRARLALRVSEALRRTEPLTRWSDLGAYQAIAPLVWGGDPGGVPAALDRLRASGDAAILLETLEAYLDTGGDARATAAALYLHRSSLYGRLNRIERIAAVDLHSGEDRLGLHLGIRILRLRGELGDVPTAVGLPPAGKRLSSAPAKRGSS